MSHTPITAETLRAQAKLGGEQLKAYILGDGTLDRQKKVERANEALALLRKEMQNDPAEQKKLVVQATRLVLQDSLDEIRGELSLAGVDAKPTLQAEMNAVDKTKSEVLGEERSMATATEYVAAEGREALDDLRNGGVKEAAMYGSAIALAATAGTWLWNNTVGRVLKWFRSDPNKPTWTERIGQFFGMTAGAFFGLLGVRWFKTDAPAAAATAATEAVKQLGADAKKTLDTAASATTKFVSDSAGAVGDAVMSSPAGAPLKATYDTGRGAAGEVVSTASDVGNVLGEDVSLATRITQTAAEDPKAAVMMVVTEGVPLAFENGVMVAWIMGKGIALPGVSLAKTIEWVSTGEQPEDYWVVWGQAGVAYILGKAAFNLFLYGKLDLPNLRTRKGLMMTAMRIAGGPIEATFDAAYNGARLLTEDGRRTLRIKFASQSLPARAVAWLSEPKLDTQEHIEQAVDEYVAYESDAAFMTRHGQNKGDAFDPKEAKSATTYVQKRLQQIKKALKNMRPQPGESQAFRDLRSAARTTSDADGNTEFRRALTRYQTVQENAAADAAAAARATTNAAPASAADAAPIAPVQPSDGPVRVRPAPVRPGPGPQRVQPAPVQPAPQEASTPEPTSAPQEPVAAENEPDGEYTLADPVERPAQDFSHLQTDPDADLTLKSADTDGEYRLADETEYTLAPEPTAPTAPEPESKPFIPEPIARRMGRSPDTDEELGTASVVTPPRQSPGGGAAPTPRFEIPEGDLERRVEASRAKEFEPDESLLDLDAAGSQHVDTTVVRPSAVDAAAINDVDATVDAAVKGETDTNVKTKKLNGRR